MSDVFAAQLNTLLDASKAYAAESSAEFSRQLAVSQALREAADRIRDVNHQAIETMLRLFQPDEAGTLPLPRSSELATAIAQELQWTKL